MQIRSDFSQCVVVKAGEEQFVPSPLPGVDRLMLDRVGGEVARATSIVRYAVGSNFSAHTHDEGEEFLVLEGTFADEYGTYPKGTYVRNPPGSRHAPSSPDGCTIFVKLRQFDPADTTRIVIDTASATWHPGLVPGLSVLPLHEFGPEHVTLARWAPGAIFKPHAHDGGEEIFVLEGTFRDEHGTYPKGSWLRSPHLSRHHPYTEEGCTIYVKTGHLGSRVIDHPTHSTR